MLRINRRALLVTSTSALIGSATEGESSAGVSRSPDKAPSPDLLNSIHEHQSAYALFCHAIHEPGHDAGEIAAISQDEETALLAICTFRTLNDHDRRAKAEYLLEIEQRGELDLREHIQAVLRSML
jgi:hypothetical protein